MKRREFLKSAGLGSCRVDRDRSARHRAIDAGAQMAPDGELAEVARYALGALAKLFAKYVAEATDNKFQIQAFAAGEIVPALQTARRRAERHRRDGPHRLLLLHRQGPDLGAVLRRAVRAERAPAERLVLRRRRAEADRRLRREVQHLQPADGQHRLRRWAAGSAKRSTPSTTSRA